MIRDAFWFILGAEDIVSDLGLHFGLVDEPL